MKEFSYVSQNVFLLQLQGGGNVTLTWVLYSSINYSFSNYIRYSLYLFTMTLASKIFIVSRVRSDH